MPLQTYCTYWTHSTLHSTAACSRQIWISEGKVSLYISDFWPFAVWVLPFRPSPTNIFGVAWQPLNIFCERYPYTHILRWGTAKAKFFKLLMWVLEVSIYYVVTQHEESVALFLLSQHPCLDVREKDANFWALMKMCDKHSKKLHME